MANENNNTQAVAVSPLKRFNSTLTNVRTQEYLNQVLGNKKDSFVTNVTSLVTNNALLQPCEPMTILYAGITATSLGLSLNSNLGEAYVVPFENSKKGVKEAQFQIGWKGLIQLALRSGQYKTINVTDIREGEYKGRDLLSGDVKVEVAENRVNLPIVGYLAYFKLMNGFEKSVYMSKAEAEAHATRYSQTYKSNKDYVKASSKWTTDFDTMAMKTVLKQLINKWGPKSIDMQTAIKTDQAVIVDEQGNVEYTDGVDYQEQADSMSQTKAARERVLKNQQKVADMAARKSEEDMPEFNLSAE